LPVALIFFRDLSRRYYANVFTKGDSMPKIIHNLENRLIAEARKQIETSGYANMTIRSVAAACEVGVGTVYNYFPSKEALVATFMLDDWKVCIAQIQHCAAEADTAEPVMGIPVVQVPGCGSRKTKLCRLTTSQSPEIHKFKAFYRLFPQEKAGIIDAE
jgi:AcrR family transcriptional regulator